MAAVSTGHTGRRRRHILLIPIGTFGVLTNNTHAMIKTIITMHGEVSELGGCARNHKQLEVQCLARGHLCSA